MKPLGLIHQINISRGGVPKRPISKAELDLEGLAGDEHDNPKIHGGVERAVCLFSLERLTALKEEGHKVFPGALGENLTVAGLDWNAIVPGVRLRFGESVSVEVTRYTTPCNKIAAYFLEDDQNRVNQERHPGWSRVYCRVITGGAIKTGDPVAIET